MKEQKEFRKKVWKHFIRLKAKEIWSVVKWLLIIIGGAVLTIAISHYILLPFLNWLFTIIGTCFCHHYPDKFKGTYSGFLNMDVYGKPYNTCKDDIAQVGGIVFGCIIIILMCIGLLCYCIYDTWLEPNWQLAKGLAEEEMRKRK